MCARLMLLRVCAALLSVGLLATACGSAQPTVAPAPGSQPPTNSQAPNGSQEPSNSQPPSDSQQPANSQPPPSSQGPAGPEATFQTDPYGGMTDEQLLETQQPLPEPIYTTADEIVEAMYQPGNEEQVVVSMLDMLGIGLYNEDGTAIRAGAENSDDDPFVFEDEARGLVEMARDQFDGSTWINFTDFYDALTELGYQGTIEDLVQAYSDAYAAFPDEPMTKFVQAQAFLDPQAQIAPLGAWLLFVDGMMTPNGGDALAALAGTDILRGVAAGARGHTGVANRNVQSKTNGNNPQMNAQMGHMWLVIQNAALSLEVEPRSVHEGHGGPGEQASFKAFLKPYGSLSPFTGQPVISAQCSGSPAGIKVTWEYTDAITAHGTPSVPPDFTNVTDASGEAKVDYVANTEKANGRGYPLKQKGTVTATVSKQDVIGGVFCGLRPSPKIQKMLAGSQNLAQSAPLVVTWHEPETMVFEVTNHYDLSGTNDLGGDSRGKGADIVNGVLTQQADGTWRGLAFGVAVGNGTGDFAGLPGCEATWNAWQVLDVVAESGPARIPGEEYGTTNGDFTMYFTPNGAAGGNLGAPGCPAVQRQLGNSGRFYAPFNGGEIINPDIGLSMKLPLKPGGGDLTYPFPPKVGNMNFTDTRYDISIEYPPPPSPP